MASRQSVSFRKRKDADEIYTFPIEVNDATLKINNSVVMVEYQDDGQVLIIAGNLPGMTGYFNNYPDIEGEEKQRRHEFAKQLLPEAKEYLEEFDPKESTSESNSGNRHMADLYVTVDEENRDRVVLRMWQMLNHMKQKYMKFLEKSEEDDYLNYPDLGDEVLEITKRL